GVEQRTQGGIDLRHEIAREEAQTLSRLDGGAREDDAVDLVAREGGGCERDGEKRLAGARGANPKGDGVRADRVDVALLVDGLRRDAQPAVVPNDVLEHARGGLVRVERAGHRGDRAGADLVPTCDQLRELAHYALTRVCLARLAVEREQVAAQED